MSKTSKIATVAFGASCLGLATIFKIEDKKTAVLEDRKAEVQKCFLTASAAVIQSAAGDRLKNPRPAPILNPADVKAVDDLEKCVKTVESRNDIYVSPFRVVLR